MNDKESASVVFECANHAGRIAAMMCAVCLKPLCIDCALPFGGTTVCDDPEHKHVLEHWTLLVRSDSEFEIDMVVQNLRCEGIDPQRYSSRAFKLTLGENPRDVAQVFVPKGQSVRAREILNNLGLPAVQHGERGSTKEESNIG